MPFGLEFVLILAALSLTVLAACLVPIAFQMRQRTLRSALLIERMARRLDVLASDVKRTTEAQPVRSRIASVLRAMLNAPPRSTSRKETRYV